MSNRMIMCIMILCFSVSSFAETHITGDITGMTFESGGNPYIIEQDILIPAESKAVIKNGCIFLFKPFTGLTVHGHLIVEGTQEQPVVFSSINDGEYNQESEQLPNPFDWNGILVSRESGTVSLKHFALRFSVYGIKSQNSNIVLENGLFRQNGQFHFTINDKIQFVQDNIAYSYNGVKETGKTSAAKPKVSYQQPTTISTKKQIIRYSSLGVGVLCTAGSIYFGVQALKERQKMSDASAKILPDLYHKHEDRYKTKRIAAYATGVVAALGYTGFILTFVF